MKQKTFNINNVVGIRLTPHGKKVWENHFNSVPVPGSKYTFADHYNNYTKDGVTSMQLWCIMEIWGGENISIGLTTCFETNILINPNDLKP